MQKIAANAFNLSGLKSFVADADEIETGAFTAFPNLTSLHLTDKVKTIGETFALKCPNLSELCFDGPIANSLLLLTAAPQLTVRVAENADENTRSLAQSCMSWSENPSEITVTTEKCAHTLPEHPNAPAFLPALTLAESAELAVPEATAAPETTSKPAPEAAAESAGMGGDTLTIYGDSCDMILSGMTLDALPCRMDGCVLLVSILDGESIVTRRTDGTLAFELDDALIWYERTGSAPEKPEAPAEQPTEQPTEAPTEQPTDVPAVPQDVPTDLNGLMEKRFVMTDADMNGFNMTPEALGGYEYSLVFHADGTMDFVMAGTAIPMLKWSYGKVTAADGSEVDGIIIDFSGQALNVVPTDRGLDMDYFGTMLMHFALEESEQ